MFFFRVERCLLDGKHRTEPLTPPSRLRSEQRGRASRTAPSSSHRRRDRFASQSRERSTHPRSEVSSVTKSAKSEFRTFPRSAASPPRPCSRRRFARSPSQTRVLFRRLEPATELARPPSTKELRSVKLRDPSLLWAEDASSRLLHAFPTTRAQPSVRTAVFAFEPTGTRQFDCSLRIFKAHRELANRGHSRLRFLHATEPPRAEHRERRPTPLRFFEEKKRELMSSVPSSRSAQTPVSPASTAEGRSSPRTVPQIKIAFRQSPAKSSIPRTIKVPSVTSESVDKQGYRPFERPRVPPNQPSFTPPHTKKSRSTCSRTGSTFITPNPASL